jgi:hypothetical protein
MAAGCVGRHPGLGIKYLVDAEGPPDSYVTCHEPYSLDNDSSNDKIEIAYKNMGHYSTTRNSSPENLNFWSQREAIRFIGKFRGHYLRLQGQWDHAQPPKDASEIIPFTLPPHWWQGKHTMDMVDAAIAGGVPWIRVNLKEQGNPAGITYTINKPPVYIPGTLKNGMHWGARAVNEMARMQEGSGNHQIN